MQKVESIIKLNESKLRKTVGESLGVPELIHSGSLILNDFSQPGEKTLLGFYIIPRYQSSLYEHLQRYQKFESQYIKQILLIGEQLTDILKIIHTSHRTYNDLKPENVMIDLNRDGQPKVHLVDFGFADKFVKDQSKEHIDTDHSVDTFRGNLDYSSLRQMNFLATGRKDDFISLFYMIISLLNHNCLIQEGPPQSVGFRRDLSVKDQFLQLKKYKEQHSMQEMTRLFSNINEGYCTEVTSGLYQLADLIEGLEFQGRPPYTKIKNIFKDTQAVIDQNN